MRGMALVLGAALAACGGPGATELMDAELLRVRVAPGDTFTLAPGQSAEIEGTGLAVQFIGVSGDSRCPVDVQCVWAGDAAVVIETTLGADQRLWKLHLPSELMGPRSVEVGGYRIELTGLDPATRSTETIPPGAYRASFSVE